MPIPLPDRFIRSDHRPRRLAPWLGALLASLASAVGTAQSVFINEIHYANAGPDRDEAIEIVGPAGTVLDGWQVVLYDGDGGKLYASYPLTGTLPDQRDGLGLYLLLPGADVLQNGDPDGIALVDAGGAVVQFLSYGGSLVAADGPAAGQTSVPMEVTQSDTTPAGQSLQLVGAGSEYGDFVWAPPAGETYGLPNRTQRLASQTGAPGPALASCPAASDDTSLTTIMAVQGADDQSPFHNRVVTVEGTVTAVFPDARAPRRFFVQDPLGDDDPATSDGLYVASGPVQLAVGERVRVTGTVAELRHGTRRHTHTALIAVEALRRCGPGNAVAAQSLEFPLQSRKSLEALEGMLIRIDEELTVSDVYQLGQQGMVTVAANGRRIHPTNNVDPDAGNDAPRTVAQVGRDNHLNYLLLDDGSHTIQPETFYTTADGRPLRVGDTVSGLVGVLGQDLGSYRLHPVVDPVFREGNRRPLAPRHRGGRTRVASLNGLDYFIAPWDLNRGAANAAELERQAAKLVAALAGLDADVVGLTGVERTEPDADAAVRDLVERLNARVGEGSYAVVPAPPWSGRGSTRNTLIYRPGRVARVGEARATDPRLDRNYRPLGNRPALAQTFEVDGERFTVVVSHLSGRGGCPRKDKDRANRNRGQGCWNQRRVAQADALLGFVAELATASGDPDVLVLGNLNAYGEEDPIDVLREGGLSDQIAGRLAPGKRYTHVHGGASGYPDHALGTASLQPQVATVAIWHINADESPALDYRMSNPDHLYRADPFRSAVRDPLVVDLRPGGAVVDPGDGVAHGHRGQLGEWSGSDVGSGRSLTSTSAICTAGRSR